MERARTQRGAHEQLVAQCDGDGGRAGEGGADDADHLRAPRGRWTCRGARLSGGYRHCVSTHPADEWPSRCCQRAPHTKRRDPARGEGQRRGRKEEDARAAPRPWESGAHDKGSPSCYGNVHLPLFPKVATRSAWGRVVRRLKRFSCQALRTRSRHTARRVMQTPSSVMQELFTVKTPASYSQSGMYTGRRHTARLRFGTASCAHVLSDARAMSAATMSAAQRIMRRSSSVGARTSR